MKSIFLSIAFLLTMASCAYTQTANSSSSSTLFNKYLEHRYSEILDQLSVQNNSSLSSNIQNRIARANQNINNNLSNIQYDKQQAELGNIYNKYGSGLAASLGSLQENLANTDIGNRQETLDNQQAGVQKLENQLSEAQQQWNDAKQRAIDALIARNWSAAEAYITTLQSIEPEIN